MARSEAATPARLDWSIWRLLAAVPSAVEEEAAAARTGAYGEFGVNLCEGVTGHAAGDVKVIVALSCEDAGRCTLGGVGDGSRDGGNGEGEEDGEGCNAHFWTTGPMMGIKACFWGRCEDRDELM